MAEEEMGRFVIVQWLWLLLWLKKEKEEARL